jgi:hypothetical protein
MITTRCNAPWFHLAAAAAFLTDSAVIRQRRPQHSLAELAFTDRLDVEPVVPGGDVDLQGHFQIECGGHDAADQFGQSRDFQGRRLKNQLVVDLE